MQHVHFFKETALFYNNPKPLVKHFITIGKAKSPKFQFAYQYCDIVILLLNVLADECNTDWETHLETFQTMLYYDCVYDHYRYFKYGLVYKMKDNPNKFILLRL